MKRRFICLSALVALGFTANAQVGIGTALPNPSAQLEIVSSNKGVLFPQVSLKGKDDSITISSGNVNSLLVYNTATAGAGDNEVMPGYYFWLEADLKWIRVLTGTSQAGGGNKLSTLVKDANREGYYIYTNEDGGITHVDVVGDVNSNFDTIINNPANEELIMKIINKAPGSVTYNSTNNSFSYVDASGNTQVIDMSTIIKGSETETTLVNKGQGVYTHTNEKNKVVNIDVVGDVTNNFADIINNPANTIIIKDVVHASTTVSNTLTGGVLITNVNGVASSPVDLTQALPSLTPIRHELIASDGQSAFPISGTPLSDSIAMYINGVRIDSSAISLTGSDLTYSNTANNNYDLVAGDKITIVYVR
ncbi:hypothetical protein [Flavobacterium sp. LAR06]|uniref:hypothetical protein n=1 Tax=Flavobacterium sp. LAR06 TaxID=3064897 RepID=UPI0035C0533E